MIGESRLSQRPLVNMDIRKLQNNRYISQQIVKLLMENHASNAIQDISWIVLEIVRLSTRIVRISITKMVNAQSVKEDTIQELKLAIEYDDNILVYLIYR